MELQVSLSDDDNSDGPVSDADNQQQIDKGVKSTDWLDGKI